MGFGKNRSIPTGFATFQDTVASQDRVDSEYEFWKIANTFSLDFKALRQKLVILNMQYRFK